MKKFLLQALFLAGAFFFVSADANAATYYVRLDGGTATQCTGLSDKAYPGSGTDQDCAYNHPFWSLAPLTNNPTKFKGGDTLIIDGSNGAQYMMGYGAPNTSDTSKCYTSWTYDCYMRPIPSGTITQPTKILGKGWDTGCSSAPQLWGTQRTKSVLNLTSSSNIEIQCLEITDHASCGYNAASPYGCNRGTPPYGPHADYGLIATDSSNVLLKNVNMHGLSIGAVHAGRLTDWQIIDSKMNTNAFVGWDGDVGANNSSNSGKIEFIRSEIKFNGCVEDMNTGKPIFCFSQDHGGYGDGIGTHKTDGNWLFDRVDFSHNVSDGLDLLYHTGNGSTVIKDSIFEGNAGNQVKTSGNASITNSKIIGNCDYFKGQTFTDSRGFNHCRAAGNSISVNAFAGNTISVNQSTVTGRGDVLLMSAGSSCDGTEKININNSILMGNGEFWSGEAVAGYYAAGAGGNGDGPCGTLKATYQNSLVYNIKGSCPAGTNVKCADPLFVGPLSGDSWNVALQAASPAIGWGYGGSGISPTPTSAPTPTPAPSTKFVVGDKVQVVNGPLNVRVSASTAATLLGSQQTGSLGTITGGPTATNGYNWWNVNYDTGTDGWSVEDYLVKVATPAPTPTPAPGGTPVPTSCPAGQYLSTYFPNSGLSGASILTRCENAPLNYNLGTGIIATGVPADNFSAQWKGVFTFGAGTYVFTANTDDGMKVYVDNTLIIDSWKLQNATVYVATRTLTQGNHEIKVEYYENTGQAVAQLNWAVSTPTPTPAPTPTPTPTPTSDTTLPVISVFDVQPRTTTTGSVAANFTATDAGGLATASLHRAPENGSTCTTNNWTGCSWAKVNSISAPALATSWTGAINDTISSDGTYWYGLHVLDKAGNDENEPAVVKVTKTTPAPTPAPTPGGNQLMTLYSLTTQIEGLISQLKAAGVTPRTGGEQYVGFVPLSEMRSLSSSSKGFDVFKLQYFLIMQNKGAAAQNLKTAGATGYFGSVTKAALLEWQKSVGISPADGYFGPKTRTYLKSIGL